jgi:hypothetical protein
MKSIEEVRAAAAEVVAERGAGFRYTDGNGASCMYVKGTDPRAPIGMQDPAIGAAVTGCLVGEILNRLDMLTDRVAGSLTSIVALAQTDALPGWTDQSPEVRYLATLQHEQDWGLSWGDALATAERRLGM